MEPLYTTPYLYRHHTELYRRSLFFLDQVLCRRGAPVLPHWGSPPMIEGGHHPHPLVPYDMSRPQYRDPKTSLIDSYPINEELKNK